MTWGICNALKFVRTVNYTLCSYACRSAAREERLAMKLENIIGLIGCLGCLAVIGIWSLIAILVVKGILSFF